MDIKRENANIDADTAMGTMLKYGSEGSKYFINNYVLPKDIAAAHINGDIHIHDEDFYMLTETCCQIDLLKLFKDGFCTGHGFLREPNDIRSYAALACIAIQANQNEMHGGQSVPNFDYAMAPGVAKTFRKEYYRELAKYLQITKAWPWTTRKRWRPRFKTELPGPVTLGNAGEPTARRLQRTCRAISGSNGFEEISEEEARTPTGTRCAGGDHQHKRRDLSGDGSADPQPEHHEFPRRRAGAVLFD